MQSLKGRSHSNKLSLCSNSFNINPENGTITLISREGIDREMVSKFVLTIEARDQRGKGNSNTAEVHITVLDVNGKITLNITRKK